MNVYRDKRKEGNMKLSEAVGKRVENLLAERNMTQYQLYKNGGIPEDRSGNCGGFVFDCRALPNPGRFAEYKKLTGQDAEVQDYLNKYKDVNDFLESTHSLIFQSVENYLERNFKNLFVNFGCTGGQHRSVFFAEKMAHALREKYPQIKVVLNHIAQNKHYVYENE